MYALSRLMLILTVVACCFGLVVVAVMSGGLGLHCDSRRHPRVRSPSCPADVHCSRDRTVGDAQRLGVRRNGWCEARADHRQNVEQSENPAAKGSE